MDRDSDLQVWLAVRVKDVKLPFRVAILQLGLFSFLVGGELFGIGAGNDDLLDCRNGLGQLPVIEEGGPGLGAVQAFGNPDYVFIGRPALFAALRHVFEDAIAQRLTEDVAYKTFQSHAGERIA